MSNLELADPTGIAALRALTGPAGVPVPPPPAPVMPPLPGLGDLAGTLAADPAQAVLITGKGGVGKTTIAARLALALAKRGLPVHLSTTDPASPLPHLAGAPEGRRLPPADMRSLAGHAARTTTPLMRLQDPEFSRILIVTLPETIPVAEAAELQEDLRRAGVEPFGWVINASLAASATHDPLLAQRAALEVNGP